MNYCLTTFMPDETPHSIDTSETNATSDTSETNDTSDTNDSILVREITYPICKDLLKHKIELDRHFHVIPRFKRHDYLIQNQFLHQTLTLWKHILGIQ